MNVNIGSVKFNTLKLVNHKLCQILRFSDCIILLHDWVLFYDLVNFLTFSDGDEEYI